jgi:AcrR family transcriptional regulator
MKASMRQHVLDVTADLLERFGVDAVSVRDVCQAAEITAPTLYHHFGDKRGLFEAVATEGFERYLADKRGRAPSADGLADLRRGWDSHVGFGLEHPAFYGLMYGGTAGRHPARAEGMRILHGLLVRLAGEGRLLMTPEQAVPTVHAACVGTTLILIGEPDAPGNEGLSERVREAVFAAVVRPEGGGAVTLSGQARALLATLGAHEDAPLTPGERQLLLELLTRLG